MIYTENSLKPTMGVSHPYISLVSAITGSDPEQINSFKLEVDFSKSILRN